MHTPKVVLRLNILNGIMAFSPRYRSQRMNGGKSAPAYTDPPNQYLPTRPRRERTRTTTKHAMTDLSPHGFSDPPHCKASKMAVVTPRQRTVPTQSMARMIPHRDFLSSSEQMECFSSMTRRIANMVITPNGRLERPAREQTAIERKEGEKRT